MLCAMCGSDTKERTNTRNIVIFAHKMCIKDRMEELGTDSIVECLKDDEVKIYEPLRERIR